MAGRPSRGLLESVVILLLGRKDINPNTSEARSGLTPLALAAKRGHKGVVKVSSAKKVQLSSPPM